MSQITHLKTLYNLRMHRNCVVGKVSKATFVENSKIGSPHRSVYDNFGLLIGDLCNLIAS